MATELMEILSPLRNLWSEVASKTVFVPVAALDSAIDGLKLPLSADIVKFMLTLLLALPLGFASRLAPPGSPRHVYNLFLGVVFAQGCYGPGWLHLPFSAMISYLLLLAAPRNWCGLAVFGWMMLYIGLTHVYRMSTDWLGWSLDFSGPQMMATIKITSMAFNYSDGRARSEAERQQDVAALEKEIKEVNESIKKSNGVDSPALRFDKKCLSVLRTSLLQQQLAVDHLPSPLVYFGWVQNFSTYQAGPALEYQEYLHVNEGATPLPSGCAAATLRQFLAGLICLGVHLALDGSFPLGVAALGESNPTGLLSDSFLERGVLSRVTYAMLASLGVQMRYFMAWKLGEAAATSFGYGSNGGSWDGCQNIALQTWLMTEGLSEASKAWNQKTQVWLQTYVYRRYEGGRSAKMLATYAVSAYWHGFYPGYYITFFNLGILGLCQDNLRAHVRPYFCVDAADEKATHFYHQSSLRKKSYDIVCFLGMHFTKTYVTLPFLLCTVGNAWACAKRLYFLGVASTLIGFLLVPLIPKKRKAVKKD